VVGSTKVLGDVSRMSEQFSLNRSMKLIGGVGSKCPTLQDLGFDGGETKKSGGVMDRVSSRRLIKSMSQVE
jgi:hypothetical protein